MSVASVGDEIVSARPFFNRYANGEILDRAFDNSAIRNADSPKNPSR